MLYPEYELINCQIPTHGYLDFAFEDHLAEPPEAFELPSSIT